MINRNEADILCYLKSNQGSMQRNISEACNCSIGTVNKCIRTLQDNGYIDKDYFLTATGRELVADRSPRNAIILAVGTTSQVVEQCRRAGRRLVVPGITSMVVERW